MKTKILSLLIMLSAFIATAQTNQTPQTFVTSVQNYFTSFNTNSTTFNNPVDLWTAENYRAGINSSAEVGLSYDVYKSVSPEVVIRNASIAGTVVSEQAGLGLSLKHFDTKLTVFLDGGYSEFDKRGYGEIGFRVKKALSQNTYGGIGMSLQKMFGTSRALNVNQTSLLPTFGVFVGCTIPGF